MSRRGQCWDNATAESFFGRLKEELFPFEPWDTKEQAIKAIEEYIKSYYNCHRIKKSIGYCSPVAYELSAATSKLVA